MPGVSENITKDILVNQVPSLTEEVREQRKKASINMIFNALKSRLEASKENDEAD